jgi:hypothetical protein
MPRKRTRNPYTKDPFKLMLRFKDLRSQGVPDADIARMENRTIQHVQNLLRVSYNLEPSLMELFRLKKLSSQKAMKLAKYTHDEQRQLHATGGDRPRGPTVESLKAILAACRSSQMPADWIAGAIAALRCALEENAIPGVWPKPK